MARVLILDGAIHRDIYQPTSHWRALLGDTPGDAVHLPSGQPVPALTGYSHVIVTGSEDSIVQPRPWHAVEAEAVRGAVRRGMPILASCFGHQMLARALAGEPHARASPTPEVGWIALERTAEDPLFQGVPATFHAFASHFDEVHDPPPPWRVLARSAGCAVQAMRMGDQPVWGIQAHPEIGVEDGRRLVEGFIPHAPRHASLLRGALATEPRDDRVAGRIVENFLRAA
jgi:GMP synthase-like glutamine amidotransferase